MRISKPYEEHLQERLRTPAEVRSYLEAAYEEGDKVLKRALEDVVAIWEKRLGENPPCRGCNNPHPFDTSIPSPLWNEVIRGSGDDCGDYLCLLCLVKRFAVAKQMFVAELWGDDVNGTVIEVRPPGTESSHLACFAAQDRLLTQIGLLERELEREREHNANLPQSS